MGEARRRRRPARAPVVRRQPLPGQRTSTSTKARTRSWSRCTRTWALSCGEADELYRFEVRLSSPLRGRVARRCLRVAGLRRRGRLPVERKSRVARSAGRRQHARHRPQVAQSPRRTVPRWDDDEVTVPFTPLPGRPNRSCPARSTATRSPTYPCAVRTRRRATCRRCWSAGRFQSAADVAVYTYGDGAAYRLLRLIPLETALAATRTCGPATSWTRTRPSWRRAEPGGGRLEAAHHGSPASPWSTPTGPSAAWCHRPACSRCCSRSTTRTWHDWVASSPRPRRHVMPWTSRSGSGCGTGSRGSCSASSGPCGAAMLVRGAEADLASDVRLAFFIPGIVYMADAVGTQTEALVIRGLSVGVPIRRLPARVPHRPAGRAGARGGDPARGVADPRLGGPRTRR